MNGGPEIGDVGTVTIQIDPGQAGEVELSLNGGTSTFLAYADEQLARNTAVVVVEVRPGLRVRVSPLP